VLVQAGLFPLVVTRDDRVEYLDALEAADGGGLKPLVDLMARLQRGQFRQATAISENILAAESDVQQVLAGLLDAATQHQEHKLQILRGVFSHAEALANDAIVRLENIVPGITTALQRVTPSGTAFVTRSSSLLKNLEIGALPVFLPWGLGRSGCCEQTLTYAASSLGMRIRL
jgi:hypothetical protein